MTEEILFVVWSVLQFYRVLIFLKHQKSIKAKAVKNIDLGLYNDVHDITIEVEASLKRSVSTDSCREEFKKGMKAKEGWERSGSFTPKQGDIEMAEIEMAELPRRKRMGNDYLDDSDIDYSGN
jgi:hypothetical protein